MIFAHGRVPSVLAKVDVGKSIKATVVAANGVLYVPTEPRLLAITAPPP